MRPWFLFILVALTACFPATSAPTQADPAPPPAPTSPVSPPPAPVSTPTPTGSYQAALIPEQATTRPGALVQFGVGIRAFNGFDALLSVSSDDVRLDRAQISPNVSAVATILTAPSTPGVYRYRVQVGEQQATFTLAVTDSEGPTPPVLTPPPPPAPAPVPPPSPASPPGVFVYTPDRRAEVSALVDLTENRSSNPVVTPLAGAVTVRQVFCDGKPIPGEYVVSGPHEFPGASCWQLFIPSLQTWLRLWPDFR